MIDAAPFPFSAKPGPGQGLSSPLAGEGDALQLADYNGNNFTKLLISQLKPEKISLLDATVTKSQPANALLPDGKDLPGLYGLLTAAFATSGVADKGISKTLAPTAKQILSLTDPVLATEPGLGKAVSVLAKQLFVDARSSAQLKNTDPGPALNPVFSLLSESLDVDPALDIPKDLLSLNRLTNSEFFKSQDVSLALPDRISTPAPVVQGAEQLVNRQVQVVAESPMLKMSIDTPLNQPQWGESLAGRVSLLLSENQQTAKININPPELGPIEIRVTIKNEQANINFFAHHGDVRDAIEDAFPKLREMLSQNGLSMGESNVSEHPFSRGNAQDEAADQAVLSEHQEAEPGLEQNKPAQAISGQLSISYIDQFV